MEKLGDTLVNHFDGIAAYCNHPVRFGVVELLNTKIKGLLRRARGIGDEAMLLLKLKWASATPIRSSRDSHNSFSRFEAFRDAPPMAAPMENPQNMSITPVARKRRGMYSAVSAVALGMAPPSPKPVARRSQSIVSTVCARAVRREPTANQSVHST